MSEPINTDPAKTQKDLEGIKQRVKTAALEANRDPNDTTLIAVSKTYDAQAIMPAIKAGHSHFGENRVQEAAGKWPQLKAQHPNITLHLIGPLQSNKTKEAVALFDAIHTIDRPKIAKAIAAEMKSQNRILDLFVQVNTGEEPQKAGIPPKDTSSFVKMCRDELDLQIQGLMCIPPHTEAPAVHFAFLAKLARDNDLKHLSMGMSADFETATQLGATYVRVGSAIFGARG